MSYPRRLLGLALLLGACQPDRADRRDAGGQADRESDLQQTTAGATSVDAKLRSAMSAAPPSIAANATIMDWPTEKGGQPVQLRAGTNGWVCFPSTPAQSGGATGEDPMCLDSAFQQWATAWASRTKPNVRQVGFGYMLRGDRGVSNTDPYAAEPTADNQWVRTGPHVMMISPDMRQLDKLPTDPKNGGPWVMWKGTPYAHAMIPIESSEGTGE
ncbi:MAG TPA: hypothetical protein VNK43_01785 [Gemmatimonadales bacterium]|nr:hypothetical protein [Gemmatimonadales bacterium]